jgi:KDO2-lipid IV(A) lauroyltransferase
MAKRPPELSALPKLSQPQMRAISGLLRRMQDIRTVDSEKAPIHSYSFRPSALGSERHYLLTLDGLTWIGRNSGSIAYREIAEVKVYQTRFLGSSKSYWECDLYSHSGRKIHLSSAHRLSIRNIEDRTPSYFPFIKELHARIAAGNASVRFTGGRGWLSLAEGAAGWALLQILRASQILDYDRSANGTSRVMRGLGPRLRGHRIARAQLEAAFPEKNSQEIENVLNGMWDNIGRIIAEYAHFKELWDFDPAHPERSKRILIDDLVVERCQKLGADHGPALLFSGHLGNWEIPPLAAAAFGREIAIVFREPKIRSFALELGKIRGGGVAELIPAGFEAPLKIRNAFKRNCLVGMLVDQYDVKGIEVTFFGRRCRVSSLLGRIARLFECAIYGSRVVRLSSGQYRFELTGPLTPPLDHNGKIDVAGTMQMVTSIIENWVCEHPEQWMWTHRRWR